METELMSNNTLITLAMTGGISAGLAILWWLTRHLRAEDRAYSRVMRNRQISAYVRTKALCDRIVETDWKGDVALARTEARRVQRDCTINDETLEWVGGDEGTRGDRKTDDVRTGRTRPGERGSRDRARRHRSNQESSAGARGQGPPAGRTREPASTIPPRPGGAVRRATGQSNGSKQN